MDEDNGQIQDGCGSADDAVAVTCRLLGHVMSVDHQYYIYCKRCGFRYGTLLTI